jgi:transcription elongation factor Elf1
MRRALIVSERGWLDVSVFRCPQCGRCYVDASWYVVELESDIECGSCHEVFNTKNQVTDRVMLKFKIDVDGKFLEAVVAKHTPLGG